MKTSILIVAAFVLFFSSCSERADTNTENEAQQQNLLAIAEINKAIQSGDVSMLHNYIAADAIDHASPAGDVKGLDSIKRMIGAIHTMGTNMKMDVIRTLADNEYVFQWMRLTGATANTDMGMPVGSNFDINAVQVTRFKDGKAVEHWEFMQPAEMAKMMGPQNEEVSEVQISADTTK